MAACFALHFPCLRCQSGASLSCVLCPLSLSGNSEPLSVFISTLELSHFHFDSNHILRISDMSEVYFHMSSKSLTIPAKRLTGFLIETPTGPTCISDWECCAVKAPFSSFLHVLLVLFIHTKNPQCGTINQILDQNNKWPKNIKEPCSWVNCQHDRSDTCYDLDSFGVRRQYCNGGKFEQQMIVGKE